MILENKPPAQAGAGWNHVNNHGLDTFPGPLFNKFINLRVENFVQSVV